jgi:hypothetical protein
LAFREKDEAITVANAGTTRVQLSDMDVSLT